MKRIKAQRIEVRSYHSYLSFSPDKVKKTNGPYKVFTTFYKNMLHEPVKHPALYL